jgi:predicted Ser/Thr protein kinase
MFMSDPNPPATDLQPEPDMSGRSFGGYQILRRLGRGGMADVYLAEQRSLNRQVALKILKGSLSRDQAYVRRFHNEAQAAASLVHANIVQIHEVGCIEGVHYIAQEYVAGLNLKQWLARHGPTDTSNAVHIMRQVVAALHRASQQGIIHRDIKPENIMLSKTGEVKVADFGLARVADDGQAVSLTQVGVTMGTPLYMSPEQVEGRPVDPRSDLYSLGVTCYEMLAGRPPFEGETPLAVGVQHLKSEPKRLENLRPDLPGSLCRVVHRLLEKNPADRYSSPTELMRELRSVHVEGLEDWSSSVEEWDTPELLALLDVRLDVTQQLDATMRSQAMLAQTRRRWWWLVPLALAGVVIGGLLAFFSRPDSLLAVDAPTVERQESASLQYWHAYRLNTEQGWLSVEALFNQSDPINQYYARRAKQRLAEWYRERGQVPRAEQLYDGLARLTNENAELATAGLFGQANLRWQHGDKADARAKLAEAIPLWNSLDRQRQNLIGQQLDGEVRSAFDEMVREMREATTNSN